MTSSPMVVLGIDSAELTGWALVARDGGGERLIRHGTRPVCTADDVEHLLASIALGDVTLTAVEEPFIHPRHPHVGLALSRLLGRWLQSLEVRGHATVTIPPAMWQLAALPGVTTRTRSADRKAASIAFARSTFGVLATADEADAIALAVYVLRNSSVASPSRSGAPFPPSSATRSLSGPSAPLSEDPCVGGER